MHGFVKIIQKLFGFRIAGPIRRVTDNDKLLGTATHGFTWVGDKIHPDLQLESPISLRFLNIFGQALNYPYILVNSRSYFSSTCP